MHLLIIIFFQTFVHEYSVESRYFDDIRTCYVQNRNYGEKKISLFWESFSTRNVPFPAGCGLRKLRSGEFNCAGDSKKIYLISRPSMEHGRWKHAVARRLMRSGVGFWRGVFIIETSVEAGRRSWKVCFLFLREGAGASEAERRRREKDREKEREKGCASSFNYLWQPFEAGVPPSFVSLLCVTIIISITWYYSRHFMLARISVRGRVMRRRTHLARAQMPEYVSAALLSSKLLKTSWFLIALAQRTSLREYVFSLFLSRSDISARPWKNFPQRVTRKREYLLSRVYLLRKQKFRFLLPS